MKRRINLSTKQILVANAWSLGKELSDICKEYDVSEKTINRWQNNPEFHAISHRHETAVYNKSTGKKHLVLSKNPRKSKKRGRRKNILKLLTGENDRHQISKKKNKNKKKNFSTYVGYSPDYGASVWTISGGGGPGTGKKR